MNDQNHKKARKKSITNNDQINKHIKIDDENVTSYNAKKSKAEALENQNENLLEKLQNLEYKFQKLEEFTGQKYVNDFCEKFKRNAQRNYDLFQSISMISKQAKQLEKEIKDMEIEIMYIKQQKNSQLGLEKNSLLNELKQKTQQLIHVQNKYESDYKKNLDEFKSIKNNIYNIFSVLNCKESTNTNNKMLIENGINESNVIVFLSEIEIKLKAIQKQFVNEKKSEEFYNDNSRPMSMNKLSFNNNSSLNKKYEDRNKMNIKNINDQMKLFFANLDISKIKAFEKIKSNQKNEDIKFNNIAQFSNEVINELRDNITNQHIGKKVNKLGIKKK